MLILALPFYEACILPKPVCRKERANEYLALCRFAGDAARGEKKGFEVMEGLKKWLVREDG